MSRRFNLKSIKLGFVSTLKDQIKFQLSRRGIFLGKLSDVSEYRVVSDSLVRKNVDLVLDFGANRGQFGLGLRGAGYFGEIISYEPDPLTYSKLKTLAEKHKNWQTVNVAIVDVADENVVLNVSSNSGYSSSLLEFSKQSKEVYSDLATIKRILVKSMSLNNVLKNLEQNRVIYIKTDIQGFEKRLFSSLSLRDEHRIVAVMIEVSLIEIYKSEWNVIESLQYFYENQFRLIGVTPEDYSTEFGHPQLNLYFERF
jgi:FkbM family methyltransferase